MGYESRFYVIEKSEKTWSFGDRQFDCGEMFGERKLYWTKDICRFDMGKIYDVSDQLRKYPSTEYYIIEKVESGEEVKIITDCYGDPLKEIPIDNMIDIIEKAMENDEWALYEPFLACLKSFKKAYGDKVAVLHYGY